MKSSNFFFYNNLKNEKLIDLIDKNNKIMNGSIPIKQMVDSKIIFGEGRKLDGKLVLFKSDLQSILNKINNMKYLSYENKIKYKMYVVKVYTSDYKTYDAYLIN